MRLGLSLLAFVAQIAAQSGYAADAVKTGGYEFHIPQLTAVDEACQRVAASTLTDAAEGLTSVHFSMPQYWDSLIDGIQVFSYSGVLFESEYGNASGHVICIAAPSQNVIAEIAFDFDAKGLSGFRAFGDKPRSESFRLMHVAQTPKPIVESE